MTSHPVGSEVESSLAAMVGSNVRPSSDESAPSADRDGLFSGPWSLAAKFGFLAAIVLLNGMAVLGSWVAQRIEAGVVEHDVNQLAFRMDAIIEPVGRDLAAAGSLSPASQALIQRIITSKNGDKQTVAAKIWKPDGTLAYDTVAGGTVAPGQSADAPPELPRALAGNVTFAYNDAARDHLVSMAELFGVPLFEIHAPIRLSDTGAVVGVIEFYQNAQQLQADISAAKRNTWGVVGLTGLGMFTILFALVHSASQLIDQQNAALKHRVAEQLVLTAQSEQLSQKLQQASRHASESNERFLRRVGSDLHDGPAQHLALALLKMDEVARFVTSGTEDDKEHAAPALAIVRQATSDAMKEIRNISSGLALPELQKISPKDALLIAVKSHERTTGSPVKVDLAPLPPRLPLPITICLFRFAQEGLNNAFRHAGGRDLSLSARVEGATLEVEVADHGPGFSPEKLANSGDHLGLTGLDHRVSSLGGTFRVLSQPGHGTRLIVNFDLPVSRSHSG